MPRGEDMPEAIADLAVRQAFDLSDTRWDYDCNRLFDALERTTSLKRIRQDQVAARNEAVIRVGEAMTARRPNDARRGRGRRPGLRVNGAGRAYAC